MITYIYPQNLKATANLWLWGLRDFTILCVCALLSVLSLTQLGFMIPAAATLCFGFLTIRLDETTVLDFIRYAVRYFTTAENEEAYGEAVRAMLAQAAYTSGTVPEYDQQLLTLSTCYGSSKSGRLLVIAAAP